MPSYFCKKIKIKKTKPNKKMLLKVSLQLEVQSEKKLPKKMMPILFL
jgi:hypothetical protein